MRWRNRLFSTTSNAVRESSQRIQRINRGNQHESHKYPFGPEVKPQMMLKTIFQLNKPFSIRSKEKAIWSIREENRANKKEVELWILQSNIILLKFPKKSEIVSYRKQKTTFTWYNRQQTLPMYFKYNQRYPVIQNHLMASVLEASTPLHCKWIRELSLITRSPVVRGLRVLLCLIYNVEQNKFPLRNYNCFYNVGSPKWSFAIKWFSVAWILRFLQVVSEIGDAKRLAASHQI